MRVNTLLVRYKDGFTEVDDATQVTADGERFGGFVNYPDDSLAEATRKAEAAIAAFKDPRWQSRIGIEPTGTNDVPFTDFGVGSTITVPDQDGSPAEVRVLGIMLTEDDAGNNVYQPTIGSTVQTLGERQGVVNRTTGGRGTGGGRFPDAQAVGPARSGGNRVVSPPATSGGVVAAFAATIVGPSGGTIGSGTQPALDFSWDLEDGCYHTANVTGFENAGNELLTVAPGLWTFSFTGFVSATSTLPTSGEVGFSFAYDHQGVWCSWDEIAESSIGIGLSFSHDNVFLSTPGEQHDSDVAFEAVSFFNSTDVSMDIVGRLSGIAFECPNIIDPDYS